MFSKSKLVLTHHLLIPDEINPLITLTNNRPSIICIQFCSFDPTYNRKIQCDYFLAINKLEGRKARQFVSGKILISGPVLGNVKVLKKSKDILYDLLIVSEFRNDHLTRFHEKQLYPIISKIAKSHSLKVGLAYNSLRKDKKNRYNLNVEADWLHDHFDVIDHCALNSYQKAASAEVIICIHSNLGFELLSFGYKVLFVSNRELVSFSASSGEFWTSSINELELEKKLLWLLTLSPIEWAEFLNEHYNYLLTGDPENSILHDLIEDLT